MKVSSNFLANLSELPAMLSWLRSNLLKVALSLEEKSHFEVAAEEILVNIIHYAYLDQTGQLEMVWEHSPSEVSLTVIDFGRPFNPLVYGKKVEKPKSLESQEEGGLGIFFAKKLVDHMDYFYEDSANHTKIAKKLLRP